MADGPGGFGGVRFPAAVLFYPRGKAVNMKVRVLVEQPARGDVAYLASGAVVELPAEQAKGLLDRGDAEPVAEKSAQRAEKRPAGRKAESR